MLRSMLLFLGFLPQFAQLAVAQAPSKPYEPKIQPASEEAEKATKRFQIPAGFKLDVAAAEPLLANPVAFHVDHQGRFYVCETFRHSAGATDNRGHMYWLDDDLAARTVEDRIAKIRKHLKDKAKSYEIEHDRVRLLWDSDGDGKADKATVFADGFNKLEDGIGAGVLEHRGNVYYTCIPNLWLLRDTKGTGQADERKPLLHGFGVHTAFLGHDLHGLAIGPDGKLYFSMGDRGFNVTTEGKNFAYPTTGAVLRCNFDGSEFEVVHRGLRNPQEIAFDDHGNLFTVDNNADRGDKAKLIQIVEGGESGWRLGFQYHNMPTALGPWNAERMWHPRHEGQPAFIVPPIANLSDGPSGFCSYPGLGLPERYRNHFFLCDFRGGSGNSGVRSFGLKPNGASFEVIDHHPFVWSILATDCDFGPDGAFYISDWVEGWNKTGKGRIYRVVDPVSQQDPRVAEGKRLLAGGFAKLSEKELAELLRHADRRVRLEAQFALAEAGAIVTLAQVASDKTTSPLARLHAIWGLGQCGKKKPEAWTSVIPLLKDSDLEVRAQAAKVLGEGQVDQAFPAIVGLLQSENARVQFFAAQSLGKLGNSAAVPVLLELLRRNQDKDAMVRHAAVVAMARLKNTTALLDARGDASPAVRLGVLLALRLLEHAGVAGFLNDPVPAIVTEAARAIHDVPIVEAYPKLAELTRGSLTIEPLLYRALNANFRLGQPTHAEAIARLACRADVADPVRVEAIKALGDWAKPGGRDRVLGQWRPLEPRSEQPAGDVLRHSLAQLFTGSDKVREESAKVAAKFGIKEVGPALLQTITESERSAETRVAALRALHALKHASLREAIAKARTDKEPRLRAEGHRLAALTQGPGEAVPLLSKVLIEGPTIIEQQRALATLAELNHAAADALLGSWLEQLGVGSVRSELQLDVLEASGKRTSLRVKLAEYEKQQKRNDPLGKYREALVGGDAENGRAIFFERAAVNCMRCHKISGQGGEVGPELTSIAKEKNREYLLEALVDPNKAIAKGFESVILELTNGQILGGIVKAEDGKLLQLMTPEGRLLTVQKTEIQERAVGKSMMPVDLDKHLTRSEIRDLVEFLSGLK